MTKYTRIAINAIKNLQVDRCDDVDSLTVRLNSHEIIELLDCKTVGIFAYSSTRELSNKRSLAPRFTDFFTDFEKKTDCFAVY